MSVTHDHEQTVFYKRQITTYHIDCALRYVVAGREDGIILIRDTLKNTDVKLLEHMGPVLGVSFSHSEIGFLASCGADGKLKIYKKNKKDNWKITYLYSSHKALTSCVDWAPYCARVACASADGVISIHTLNVDHGDPIGWCVSLILNAHSTKSVNSVSWSQYIDCGRMCLVSGGDDNKLKIWQGQPCCTWLLTYESEDQLAAIKNVSWRPIPGLLKHAIASLTVIGRVMVWMTDDFLYWHKSIVEDSDVMYQVDFSPYGNKLVILYANSVVKFWNEDRSKLWKYSREIERIVHPMTPTESKRNKIDLFTDLFNRVFFTYRKIW